MKGTKAYVSGPMTGLAFFNYPVFDAMAETLENLSVIPINPARHPEGLEYEEYMELAMIDVEDCDWVCLLPGWERSPGAIREAKRGQELGKVLMECMVSKTIAFNHIPVDRKLEHV